MGIKRKIKRFRYYCSWRYPKLFGLAQKLAFPLEVSILCITLYMGVKFYQQHYSFEAKTQAHQFEQTNTVREATRLALNTESPFPASQDKTLTAAGTTIQVKRRQHDDQAVLSKPSQQDEDSLSVVTNTKSSNPKRESELFDSEWILNQNTNNFTIQLASSNDRAKLKNYALDLPVTIPLVIYPSRISTDGNITYGLSAGVFKSNEEALSALATLPEALGEYGLWVRKIADISTQISALDLKP